MKNPRTVFLIAVLSLLSMGGASCSGTTPAWDASSPSRVQENKDAGKSAKLPTGVDIYATTDAGHGQLCKAGAKSDQDGMNERPVVYLSKATGGFAWHVQLRIPKDMYQGRATHCVASGNQLYVLIQIDTQSQQTSSQTLLQVVELNRATGAVMAMRDIQVPGVSAAYSAWVDEGGDRFKLDENKLVIKGSYELLSDRDNSPGKEPTSFTVEVPENLHP